MIAVPILIFVVCLLMGVFAASSWLPELPAGPVGDIAFFVVCGLVGSALGVAGLRIYGIVEFLSETPAGYLRNIDMADRLTDMLWESGLMLGIGMGVYLLARNPRLGWTVETPSEP